MSYEPSADQLRATVDAVARYGGLRPAARELGIPLTTLYDRVKKAKASAKNSEYTAPVVQTVDVPIDDLINRLIDEGDRQVAAQASRDWMRFRVKGDKAFCLVFVGDPHGDQCHFRLLRDHLDIIEKTPRMWGVGLGDWVNGWVGRLRQLYAHQTITERDAYRVAQWLFSKPIWWLMLLGNHDGQRWHGDASPLNWMLTEAAVPVQEWQAKFVVECGDAEWPIWAAHDFPGHSMWNALHGPGRRAQVSGAQAALYIAGHKHTYGVAHTQHEHTGKQYWIARARGYKLFDNHTLELGFGDQTMGHSIAAVFNPRDKSLFCFPDVQQAARYLEFLHGQS